MKKTIFPLFFCCFFIPVFAQHYYKDLISNKQLLKDMAAYKENKIRSVNIKSFEDDGSPSEGFFCQRKISKDYKKSELFTRSNVSASSMFTSYFDNAGKLLSTNDSSDISISNNRYTYDASDRIQSIRSSIRSQDDDFKNEIVEEHIYTYDEKDHPQKMTLIKNHRDTTIILFSTDDKGNVNIEKDSRTGTKYFYYYDGRSRLTEIVQDNYYKASRPDYIFEYNSAGLLGKMTATEEGGKDFYVWRYTYDAGLRTVEKCFSKDGRLMGSVEYEYK